MILTIDFQDADELKTKLKGLLATFGGDPLPLATPAERIAVEADPLSVPPRRKPGRPKAKESVAEPFVEPLEEEVVSTPVTFADAKAALAEVNQEKGMEVARAILLRFGASMLSKLTDEQYPAFIAACREAKAA